jgi:hypothetical protein
MFYILGLLVEIAFVIYAKSENNLCKSKNTNYIPEKTIMVRENNK